MINVITPLMLTYNEAPNIGRTLEKLKWAKDVIIVDSFSTDDTLPIVKQFPQARIFQLKFYCHSNQWNFGLTETGIGTDWVLALDADYVLSDELIEELRTLAPADDVGGYRANFLYCVEGRPLRASVYPPVTVLYRREGAHYEQDGHTQRVVVKGAVKDLKGPIYHDDRKSLSHWVMAQNRYMELEAGKLLAGDYTTLSFPDRLRRWYVIAPPAMFLYCLLAKRAILDGWPGVYYALQRAFAEILLSLHMLKHKIGNSAE
jgi:glycosyltransferase involved in cell wall biosynthesis